MTPPLESHAELIASSAAHAAWVGAAASTFASVVALSVAVWGARREEGRNRRLARERETAFSFGMVGAVEMIKPILVAARREPTHATPRRKFAAMVDHAHVIADAALAIQVFDMQMLRDAYLLRGLLNALRALPAGGGDGAIPHAEVREVAAPILADVLEADDRFYARLPAIGEVRGIHGRTPLDASAPW